VTSACLRQTIYEPITECTLMRAPPPAPAPGAPQSLPGGAAASRAAAAAPALREADAGSCSSGAAAGAGGAGGGGGRSGGREAGWPFLPAGPSSSSLTDSSQQTSDSDNQSESEGAGPAAAGAAESSSSGSNECAPARAADCGRLLRWRRRGHGGDGAGAVRRDRDGKHGGMGCKGAPQAAAAVEAGPPQDVVAKGGAAAGLAWEGVGAAAASRQPVAPEWRKSLATLAVFVASGMMHELIVWWVLWGGGWGRGGPGVGLGVGAGDRWGVGEAPRAAAGAAAASAGAAA
jgi:hypothetical protein